MTQTIYMSIDDRRASVEAPEVIVSGTQYDLTVDADADWYTTSAYVRVFFAGYYYQVPVSIDGTGYGEAVIQMPVGTRQADIGLWADGIASSAARIKITPSVLDDDTAIGVEFTGDIYDAWAEETSELLTDQTYDPTSAKAQSGVAIAGLASTLLHKAGNETKSGTLYFDTAYPKMTSAGMESPVPVYALPTFGVISDTTGQVNNLVHTLGDEAIDGTKTMAKPIHGVIGNLVPVTGTKRVMRIEMADANAVNVWIEVYTAAKAYGLVYIGGNAASPTLDKIQGSSVGGYKIAVSRGNGYCDVYVTRTQSGQVPVAVVPRLVARSGYAPNPSLITWDNTSMSVPEGALEVEL